MWTKVDKGEWKFDVMWTSASCSQANEAATYPTGVVFKPNRPQLYHIKTGL